MRNKNSSIWIDVNIGEVSDVVGGGTPDTKDSSNFTEKGKGIPWITPADLSGYSKMFISTGARDLSKKGYENSSAKILPKGTILFSSRAPIGYVAIAENEITTNQGFKSFVLHNGIDSVYAYYFLISIKEIAEEKGTGTTFKEISGTTAKTLPFRVFPFAEQKEIADRLDNLLAQVESIKLRLKKVAEIIKRFKQSVLNVAISGNISADWRASSQYNSENIPVSWKKKYLPEILRFKPQNGYSGKPVKYETKTKVLSLSATTMGVFNPDCFKYLDEFIPEESHVWLKNNDILLQRGNTLEYVGVPAIYKGKDNQYIYPDLMIRLCVQQEIVLSDYLYYYLSSEKIRNYMRKNATGTTGTMPKINQGVLEKLIVNLPPYSEQNVIVERIDKFFKGIQLLEMKIQDAQGYMDNLEKSVLTKAFSGELTAEWREQHPELISGENSAVALLERIKEEKNSVKNSVRPLKSAKNVKIALKRK